MKYKSYFSFIILMILGLSSNNFAQFGNIKINSFTPKQGKPGERVDIYGKNFLITNDEFRSRSSVPNYLTVKFGSTEADIISATSTHITAKVPNISQGNYKITVYHPKGRTQSSTTFKVLSKIENIAYLHGFNSNNGAWYNTERLLRSEFNVLHSTNRSYNGRAPISYSASRDYNRLVPYNNTVVIAHSMGGVVAREMIRQKGKNKKIKALITVGTPHKGAPIAYYGRSDKNLTLLVKNWVSHLASPWLAYFNLQGAWNIGLKHLFPFKLFVDANFDRAVIESPAARDLIPNSNFMKTLNRNTTVTLPDAVYTIYGHEDWYSHWRMADCAANGKPEENNYVNYLFNLMNYYNWGAFVNYVGFNQHYANYNSLMLRGFWERALREYNLAFYYKSIGDEFTASVYALNTLHQYEWNRFMVGEALTYKNLNERDAVNDAFIPRYSQAPNFVEGKRHLEARHTNHLEETTKREAIDKIREALMKKDINLRR